MLMEGENNRVEKKTFQMLLSATYLDHLGSDEIRKTLKEKRIIMSRTQVRREEEEKGKKKPDDMKNI